MVARVVWEQPPTTLAQACRRYSRGIMEGLWALFDLFAAKAQALAQQLGAWTDRTGAARQGLRGFVEKSATGAVLYLVHSVFYGVFLELGTRFMDPRPAIGPALEATYGPLMAAVRRLVGG